jgi:cyclopropane-fatty-acyl-phospholipid synthase
VRGDQLPVRFEFFDGSGIGPVEGPGVVRVRSADAVRRMMYAPGELGLARAYVAGDLDLEGDACGVLRALQSAAANDANLGYAALLAALRTAGRLGAIGLPLPHPDEEAHPHGGRHSKRRDAEVISHHDDVGNEFYRLLLGPSLTYSCARFTDEADSLEAAQTAKHDLVCRKLGLPERPGLRLVDVGWGGVGVPWPCTPPRSTARAWSA